MERFEAIYFKIYLGTYNQPVRLPGLKTGACSGLILKRRFFLRAFHRQAQDGERSRTNARSLASPNVSISKKVLFKLTIFIF